MARWITEEARQHWRGIYLPGLRKIAVERGYASRRMDAELSARFPEAEAVGRLCRARSAKAGHEAIEAWLTERMTAWAMAHKVRLLTARAQAYWLATHGAERAG